MTALLLLRAPQSCLAALAVAAAVLLQATTTAEPWYSVVNHGSGEADDAFPAATSLVSFRSAPAPRMSRARTTFFSAPFMPTTTSNSFSSFNRSNKKNSSNSIARSNRRFSGNGRQHQRQQQIWERQQQRHRQQQQQHRRQEQQHLRRVQQQQTPTRGYGAPVAAPVVMTFSPALPMPVVMVAPPAVASSGFSPRLVQSSSSSSSDSVLEVAVVRAKRATDSAKRQMEAAVNRYVDAVAKRAGVMEVAEFDAVLTLDDNFLLLPLSAADRGQPAPAAMVVMTRRRDSAGRVAASTERRKLQAAADIECEHVLQMESGDSIDALSTAFPFGPSLTELAVRKVKPGQNFEQRRNDFLDFLSTLDGVGQSREFRSVDDSSVRVGTTVYASRSSVEEAAKDQFTSDATPEYYNSFDLLCYFILNRRR